MMKSIVCALALAISTSCVLADSVMKLISDPNVQAALIINLRNPSMRQQLNAALAKQPGSAEKVNRFANCITHVVIVTLADDNGNQIGLVAAMGNFDKNVRQILAQEGLPAELMDANAVCLGISLNGQALTREQVQQVGASIAAKNRKR